MRPRSLILGLALALLVGGGAAAPVQAGIYEVLACNGGAGADGATSSFETRADPGMTSYQACPPGEGLVTRSVYDGGQTAPFDGAYQFFDAPPGATVDSISFIAGLWRHDCDYTVGLLAGAIGDYGGRLVWGHLNRQDCLFEETPNSYYNDRQDVVVDAPRLRMEARCGRSPNCSRSGGTSGMRMKDIRVRVRDEVPPALSNGRGSLWGATGWQRGTQTVGFDVNDNVGVRATSVLVAGTRLQTKTNHCDYTQRVPCPQSRDDFTLDTVAIRAGRHDLLIEAIDSAGNTAVDSTGILIDNTPPTAPERVALRGGDGWRARNSFDVRWSNPSQGSAAPIAAAEHELCPTQGPCSHGSHSGDGLAAIDGFEVPGSGVYTLRLWLRDAAGNEDRRRAAPPLQLRFDDEPPELAFAEPNVNDPTKINVIATDRHAGVASGVVEVRRAGSDRWEPQRTEVLRTGHLQGQLADEGLPDGLYDVRARATDQAGNQKTTDRHADGRPARLMLPVRRKTTLVAGHSKRGRHRPGRLRHSVHVRFGRRLLLIGRLVAIDGRPIRDAQIRVQHRPDHRGGEFQRFDTVRTDTYGWFSFRTPKGPSRTIRFHYPGTGTIRSATADVNLLVRAQTTFRAHRRSLRNGQTVRFGGTLRGGSVPNRGKLVELQVLLRNKWRTFSTTRSDRRGRWRYRYRFDGTRGRQVYRFRARVPEEATYPFEAGTSRPVSVTVRGP